MAFNGTGTYNRLYSWQTDAANSVNISASRMDGEDNGFAAGLTNCITRDGQSPWLANIPAGGFKITGLANGSASTDSCAYGQLTSTVANYLPLAGGTMTGALVTLASASGGAGVNLPHGAAPTSPVNGDVWTTTGGLYARINGVTKGPFLDAVGSYLPLSGGTLTGKLTTVASASGNAGLNLPQGAAPSSPVNGDLWTTASGVFAQIAGSTGQLATMTYTSNANGVAIGVSIGGTTYYLQFMTFGALAGNGSTTLTYPVAFGTAIKGYVASKQNTYAINDGVNFLNAPGLSSCSVVNGGTSTAGGSVWVFGY